MGRTRVPFLRKSAAIPTRGALCGGRGGGVIVLASCEFCIDCDDVDCEFGTGGGEGEGDCEITIGVAGTVCGADSRRLEEGVVARCGKGVQRDEVDALYIGIVGECCSPRPFACCERSPKSWFCELLF